MMEVTYKKPEELLKPLNVPKKLLLGAAQFAATMNTMQQSVSLQGGATPKLPEGPASKTVSFEYS